MADTVLDQHMATCLDFARFDLSVLDKTLTASGIEHGPVKYACTMSLASDGFPELEKYSLDAVCDRCCVNLEKHHDATCDARACMGAFLFLDREYHVADNPSSSELRFDPLCARQLWQGGREGPRATVQGRADTDNRGARDGAVVTATWLFDEA